MNITMRPLPALVAIALLSLAPACKPRQQASGGFAASLDPDIKAHCATWRQDPYGCNKQRTAPLAESIVAAFFAAKPTRAEVEQLVGPAENESTYNGLTTLDYYFDTQCQGGKPAPETVYCLMQIQVQVDNNRMKFGGVVCG